MREEKRESANIGHKTRNCLRKKEMGFRRKCRFVGVLPTCVTHLYKFEFIHMALGAYYLIKYRKLQ